MIQISIGAKTGFVRTAIGTLAIVCAAALVLAVVYFYRTLLEKG